MVDGNRVVQGGFAVLLTVGLLTACSDDGPQARVAVIAISMDDFTIDAPDVVPAGLVEVQ